MLPRLALTTLIVLLPASPLAAQPSASAEAAEVAPPGPVLLVSGGWVAFADDGTLDHGAGGIGVEWRATSRLAVGGDGAYMVGPGADRDLLLAGVLRAGVLKWDRRVVPYGLAIAGVLFHRDRVFGMDTSDVGMLLQVGGGVRVAVSRRVFLAPEFALGAPPHVRATLTVGATFR